MLLVVAPLLVAPLAALPIIFAELETPVYWAVMMALVVLASLAHLTPAYTQVRPPLRPVAILGDNQVIVLGAQLTEQEAPRTATLEVTWQPLQPLEVDYNIFFQALAASDRAPAQVVAQLDAQPLG